MNKECLRALNSNLQRLTCSSKHLSTSIVPMDLLGLLRWYELKDHGWEISGPKPELFAGEWWESLCSKVSNYAMLIGRGGRGLGKKKKKKLVTRISKRNVIFQVELVLCTIYLKPMQYLTSNMHVTSDYHDCWSKRDSTILNSLS